MPTAQQIKSLIRSYGDADGEMFVSVALQIAAHEAKSGKAKLARELKELVDEIRRRQAGTRIGGSVPIARPSGELASLLAVTYPGTRLSQMVLPEGQEEKLDRILVEFRQRSKLREHGLSPRRKLLLVGPPGVGKTMTSRALAGELKLPHFAIQFHSLITKYMGETAAKLHAVFEAIRETVGVYLFDEVDAIGAMRSGTNDVGEIRRVLNSFLQFLEQDDSDSLIVAATNLEEMLDAALFRRFDDVITYDLPDEAEAARLVQNRLAAFGVSEEAVQSAVAAGVGLSHAEIVRGCDEAAKDAVLSDRDGIDAAFLRRTLEHKVERIRK